MITPNPNIYPLSSKACSLRPALKLLGLDDGFEEAPLVFRSARGLAATRVIR